MATNLEYGASKYKLRTSKSGAHSIELGGKFLELTTDASLSPSRPRLGIVISGTVYYVRESFGTRVKAIRTYNYFNTGRGSYAVFLGEVSAYDSLGNDIIGQASRNIVCWSNKYSRTWGSAAQCVDGNFRTGYVQGRYEANGHNDIHGKIDATFTFPSPVELSGIEIYWGYSDRVAGGLDSLTRYIKYQDAAGTWHNLYYTTSKSLGTTWGTYVGTANKVGKDEQDYIYDHEDRRGYYVQRTYAHTCKVYKKYYNMSGA